MGHKNPDLMVSPPDPMKALTLAEMHVKQWELRGTCNRCKVQLCASLPAPAGLVAKASNFLHEP
jgi:hypothetical protein